MAHSHSSNSSAVYEDPNTRSGSSPNKFVAGAHSHTSVHDADTTSNAGGTGSSSATTDAISNELNRLEVIWIQSNGTPTQIPAGALTFWHAADAPPGWSVYTDSQGRYLRGATAGGDGGSIPAGSASHAHVGSHSHTTTHFHTAKTSGAASSTGFLNDSALEVDAATTSHNHQVTLGTTVSGSTSSDNANAIAHARDPLWLKTRVVQPPSSVDPPPQIIAIWLGNLASIPEGWALCDGTNGTPNLLGTRLIRGAETNGDVGTTGGVASHSHTATTHSHTGPGSHTHNKSFGSASATTKIRNLAGSADHALTHSSGHNNTSSVGSIGTTGSIAPTIGSTDNMPPFTQVAFIQLVVVLPDPPEMRVRSNFNAELDAEFFWTFSHPVVGESQSAFQLEIYLDTLQVHDTGKVVSSPPNQAANPGLEVNADGWFGFGGTFARSTAQAHSGVASGLFTPDGVTATGVAGLSTAGSPFVNAGYAYQMSVWVYSPNGYTITPAIAWRDSGGTIFDTTSGDPVVVPSGVWTKLMVTGTAPIGAVTAGPRVSMPDTPAASDLLYMDDMSFWGHSYFVLPGGTLSNDETYTWRVRVWDSADEVSEWPTADAFVTEDDAIVIVLVHQTLQVVGEREVLLDAHEILIEHQPLIVETLIPETPVQPPLYVVPTLTLSRNGDLLRLPFTAEPGYSWCLAPGIEGLDQPTTSLFQQRAAGQFGSYSRGVDVPAREIFLPILTHHPSYPELLAARDFYNRLTSPYHGHTVRITVQRPDGTSRYIDGFRTGDGPSWDRATWIPRIAMQKFGQLFVCPDPWWRGAPVTLQWSGSSPTDFFPITPVQLSADRLLGVPQSINVPGDVIAYPAFTITGPTTSVTATHVETGRSWTFNAVLDPGEEAMVHTDPRFAAEDSPVHGPNEENWFEYLEPPYDLWSLPIGAQTIEIEIAGLTSATQVSVSIQPLYETA
jgi:hypothetical protein